MPIDINLPKITFRKRTLRKLWILPELKLPEFSLPRLHIYIGVPEEIIIPTENLEIERIEFMPFKPRELKLFIKPSSPVKLGA